jgi:hypothetical protein
VVGNADDVARLGAVGNLAVLGKEQDRRVHRDRLAQARRRQLHAALERARDHAHERDAVAVLRVHVGLHLEHEAGHVGAARVDRALVAGLRARRRGIAVDRGDQFGHAKVLERRSEIDRRQVAMAIGFQVELRIAFAAQFDFLEEFVGDGAGGRIALAQELAAVAFGPAMVSLAKS